MVPGSIPPIFDPVGNNTCPERLDDICAAPKYIVFESICASLTNISLNLLSIDPILIKSYPSGIISL